jgi:hypothetical protein
MTGSLKQQLFTGWHFMRWLRLVMGIGVIAQAFWTKDAFIGIIGAFFVYQSLSGTGCCGMNGCTISPNPGPADRKITDPAELAHKADL